MFPQAQKLTVLVRRQGAGNELGSYKSGCSIVNKVYRTRVKVGAGDAKCGHRKEYGAV